MLWSEKVLESIRVAYGRNNLVNIFNTSTRVRDVFSFGKSIFVFEDSTWGVEVLQMAVQPLAVGGFWKDFFVPLLGFGLLWHVSFVLACCFFLLASSFKCFPFERVISFCFVFRSLRFGSVLVSLFSVCFRLFSLFFAFVCFGCFFPCIGSLFDCFFSFFS